MSFILLHHAHIYTNNPHNPITDALLIDTNKVIAVGDDALNSNLPETNKIDMGGQIIIPGLCDSHIHLGAYAQNISKVDCETSTRQECLEKVKLQIQNTPPGAWVLGHGWNHNLWPEGIGSAKLLDEIAPRNPVYLTAKSLHAAWTNSYAMKLANITQNTPDPDNGVIQRDSHGHPTGILYENAMRLIEKVIPKLSPSELLTPVQNAIRQLNAFGLTRIHDFDGPDVFLALQYLNSTHQLSIRVTKNIMHEQLDSAIDLGVSAGLGDDFLNIGHLKLFADGALGPQTAAMFEPYLNSNNNIGILSLDKDEIIKIGNKAARNRIPLAIHAIGDRAVHHTLAAISVLQSSEQGINDSVLRHRIEHVQLYHEKDRDLLSRVKFTASMQPIHAPSDKIMATQHWGDRIGNAYAWKTIHSLGQGNINLAFGSDAPVESPNPFWGLYAAVTGNHPQTGELNSDNWHRDECLTIQEAIHAYTTGPAFATRQENRLGRLIPGYYADLIVLREDPFKCEPHQLISITPTATMVDGIWVYQA